jgi:glycosyltransferase involved in cell wall biosynthesis
MSAGASFAVSVVMATYNGARFLPTQLESIVSCLRDGDELIVVDDGSSDETLQILEASRWPGLVVVRNPVNLGVKKAFEVGLRRATKEVVFLSDQDDVWMPGKRDAFVQKFVEDPECVLVISDAVIINADGRVVGSSFMSTLGGFRPGVLDNVVRNRFIGCAMALRLSCAMRALPIPHGAPMHDSWLGIVAGLSGKIRYIDRPYLMYRRHTGNVTPPSRRAWLKILKSRVDLLSALARWISGPEGRAAINRRRLKNIGAASNRRTR